MLKAYIIFICVLIVLCILFLINMLRYKSNLKRSLGILLTVCCFTLLSDILFVAAKEEFLGNLGFSMFSAMIDWLLYALLEFIFIYTNHNTSADSSRRHKKFFKTFALIDTLCLMLNPFLNHVCSFRINELYDGSMVREAISFTVFYYGHLFFCYVMSALIALLLVMRGINSSSYYRKKYFGALKLFMLVLALDALCVALHFSMNVSIIFYGFLAVILGYYALVYIPSHLVTRMQNLMMDRLGSGIICFDEAGKCVYYNNRFWSMLGLKPDIERAENDYVISNEGRKMLDGGNRTWSETHVVNGEERTFDFYSLQLQDEKNCYMGCYYCCTDVTEKKKFFENRINREKNANQAKTRFLSQVSHEIRTPVNSIYGMNEMILRECNDPETLHYATQIKSAAETLIGLINDVLDFSKIESGHMEVVNRSYKLSDVLRNVCDMTGVRAEEKGLEFIYRAGEDVPAEFIGDDVRLEQILMNLLSNAVKYTERGNVTLEVSWEAETYLCFSVSDTGIGIREESLPRLFEEYERLDKEKTHSIQGTGLGLNITSRLVKLMDGELKVESTYGEGSVFTCRLPQKCVGNDRLVFSPHDLVASQKVEYVPDFEAPDAEILVVDDNMINMMVFCNLLKKTRVKITRAGSGAECLKWIKEQHFDLIFMDHMMPGMSGIETYEEMKRMEHLCVGVPVIMLTANAVNGAEQEYLSYGFSDYLSKPIIPKQLEALVMKHLPANLVKTI